MAADLPHKGVLIIITFYRPMSCSRTPVSSRTYCTINSSRLWCVESFRTFPCDAPLGQALPCEQGTQVVIPPLIVG